MSATCGVRNPHTGKPCAKPANHPETWHTPREVLALSADGCGCWSKDCAACMRRTHAGERPTSAALRRNGRI